MDKNKLSDFREKLIERQRELTQGFARAKSQATEGSSGGTEDFVDYAVSAYTKEFLLSLSDLDRRTLQLVDEALARIQKGAFGVCIECQKEIGDKRLQAVPWTPYCISCQERLEQEESHTALPSGRPLLD